MFPTTLIPRARLRGFRPICARHRRSGARAAPRFIARSPSIPPRATVKSKDSWTITGRPRDGGIIMSRSTAQDTGVCMGRVRQFAAKGSCRFLSSHLPFLVHS